MKRGVTIGLFVVVLLSAAAVASAQSGPGTWRGYGPEGQGWFCPYCGAFHGYRGGMEPGAPIGPGWTYGMEGHMRPHWGGMGPGMMHRWGGMGPGRMSRHWYGAPDYGQARRELGKEEARDMVQEYLDTSRNPNLKVGEIEDKGRVFEAEILTKQKEDLVDRIQIHKRTAWMRSVYE